MSISSSFVGRAVVGNEVCTWGTYTDSGAATADDINTKIHLVSRIFLQPTGATVSTNAPVVNETLPTDGSAVNIRCDASQVGLWIAYGDCLN
jgi:hypothetical protein